jgi:predicted lipase
MFYKILLSLSLVSCGVATQYNESLSKQAINLSQAAYCVYDEWSCETCMDGFELDYVIEKHGEKALMGVNDDENTLFVSFRGSETILNWIDNLQVHKISPYDDKSIEVSNGFFKAYSYLQSEIFDKLDAMKNKYNTNNLMITGHSLGAAIGTLLAYDILTTNKTSNYDIRYLITFGSPRIGNDKFVESFENYALTHYRITHYYDMVPHLPQEFLNYLHVPSEIWYNEDNTISKQCNDSYNNEDETCSDSCSPTHCTSVDDHLLYMNISLGINGMC